MKLIRYIYFRHDRLKKSIFRKWYRMHAVWISSMHQGRLDWPYSVTAVVPVRCDGAGGIILGEGVKLGYRPAPRMGNGRILIQARGNESTIRIGADCSFSNNISIISRQLVEIGERTLIGDGVFIIDSDFHRVNPSERFNGSDKPQPVHIGNNVWLGSRAMVLKGVTIGDNTVVGAGSVVAKSLPANVIAAGIPARVVRQLEQ